MEGVPNISIRVVGPAQKPSVSLSWDTISPSQADDNVLTYLPTN